MTANLTPLPLHWAITLCALWVASHVFKGLRFSGAGALVVSILLLGAFVLGGSPEFTIQTSPGPTWL